MIASVVDESFEGLASAAAVALDVQAFGCAAAVVVATCTFAFAGVASSDVASPAADAVVVDAVVADDVVVVAEVIAAAVAVAVLDVLCFLYLVVRVVRILEDSQEYLGFDFASDHQIAADAEGVLLVAAVASFHPKEFVYIEHD